MLKFNYSAYQIVLVGCGGTGSALLYFLSRYLCNSKKDVLVTLIDGDTVEEKNILRQSFAPADIGQNKAKVLSTRYTNLLGLRMSYVDKFLSSPDDLREHLLFRDRVPVIVGCLDNTTARSYLNQCFESIYEGMYIDSGNEQYHGQVVFGLKRKNMEILPSVGHYYPEAIVPQKNEEEGYHLGCADLGDQTMSANLMSAHLTFSYIRNILDGCEDRHMSLFDSQGMSILNKPIKECPEFYPDAISGYSWSGKMIEIQQ